MRVSHIKVTSTACRSALGANNYLSTSKPHFCGIIRCFSHATPSGVHALDFLAQLTEGHVLDGQRQEDGLPSRVVDVERLEPLDEALAPCPRPAPLAERAKACIAKLAAGELGLWGLPIDQLDFEADAR